MKRKIGLYPGTFDPIHKGHIAFALEAMKKQALDIVVFLPEHSPRNKHNVTPLLDRLALLETTLARYEDKLFPLVIHAKRFTYESAMPELREAFGDEAEFTLLIGSDVAKTIEQGWEDADKLFAECKLVIGLRNDDTAEEISNALIHTSSAHCVILMTDFPFESSTKMKASK